MCCAASTVNYVQIPHLTSTLFAYLYQPLVRVLGRKRIFCGCQLPVSDFGFDINKEVFCFQSTSDIVIVFVVSF